MPNVLLITLDQFRGDCLSVAGHPLVQTPNLDALAAAGVRLSRHYSQAAPCGPGRACLYTGMYQMNSRVVANGTPLDARFDNIALAARRAGYEPALFGYTDQSVDPREATGPDDPRMQAYTGVLPGFDPVLALDDDQVPWRQWLESKGYADPGSSHLALTSEPERPVDVGVSTFVTDTALEWLDHRADDSPWFIHLSYLRPHPPYAAAGEFATMYDPADVPLPVAPMDDIHPLHAQVLGVPGIAAPTDERAMRELAAQYFGMISEVDAQLGRVWAELQARGLWDDTIIVVTADHGEQLGDHGLLQKLGWFEESYAILGIVRDPRHAAAHGTVVGEFTENIDIFPTLCDAMGIDVPVQCDGLPLTPFLRGESPPWWRTAAHWEWDWRFAEIGRGEHAWPWDRRLERRNLSVLRDAEVQYVQFGDGTSLCFDLIADPTARTLVTDPAMVLPRAQAMLTWRANHLDRTLTDFLVERGGIGRLPPGVPDTFTRGEAV
ncbi:MAG: sulfatase [Ilumatobacteraceae bacterium]|nr:sulfatase [Ilumatobacteraceae bacterium]